MDEEKFRQLASEALDALPEEFAEKLNNVEVVVEEFPSLYQIRKSKLPPNSLLLGLYEGIPQTKRGIYYSALPDKITIFKNAIERICLTEEEVKKQVRKTVMHEIGHHFGLSDKDMM